MSFHEIEIPEGLYGKLHKLWRQVRNPKDNDFDIWLDCEMAGIMHEWDPSWSGALGADQPTRTALVTAEVAFTLRGISIAAQRVEIDVVVAVAARILQEVSRT